MRIGNKLHAFSFHLLKTAIENMFLHLEFRDAVAEQAADAVRFFVNRNPVSGSIQLLGGAEPGGTRADYRDFLA